jgi:hypothetical protein
LAAALEHEHRRRRRCTGCGFDRLESMAPGRDQAYDSHAEQCHACSARARATQAFRDGGGELFGVYFPISERDPL